MPRTRTPSAPRLVTTKLTPSATALTLVALCVAGCGGGAAPHGGGGAGAGMTTDGGGGATTDGGGGTTDGGGDTSATCAVGGLGQLALAVVGLPASATPMVRVGGAGLASALSLSTGTPVSIPARGGYELDYRRVKVAPAAGGIVGKAYYLSASSFDGCVRPGVVTTATLTYAPEPGSEHLWISVSNAATLGDELAGYASADLAATAPKDPTLWKAKNFASPPGGGAFDSSGNLWVPGGDVINMYAMRTLATAGDAAPEVVITLPASSHAAFAAFDTDGNLWVSLGAPANKVVRYGPADLAASGSPTPAVVITSPELVNPAGLAFTPLPHRDLWVASQGNDEVLGFYEGAHLDTSYAGAADVVVTAKSGGAAPAPYTQPSGLAFDEAGTLWVGYVGNLVGFTLTQQMAAQQMTRAVFTDPLALNVSTGAGGFAFDESGGLWCAGAANTFRRFPKSALATTGDAAPDIVITSNELGSVGTLVLDPSPSWSALQDWL